MFFPEMLVHEEDAAKKGPGGGKANTMRGR